jgi:hypothetical protein
MLDYNEYETNTLFESGDQVYLLNSIFYATCALRDCDFFWFMPEFGVYRTVGEIMSESSEDMKVRAVPTLMLQNM